jgi:hypothetical protein
VTTIFNKDDFFEKLKHAGFSHEQARLIIELQSSAAVNYEESVRQDYQRHVKQEIELARLQWKTDIAKTNADLTQWFGTIVLIGFAVLQALMIAALL